MKILIDTYSTALQNQSGGIQIRIKQFCKELDDLKIEYDLFDKWTTKIEQYDIVHIFKVSLDSFYLINYAKSKNIPVIISPVIPLENPLKIFFGRYLSKLNINTSSQIIRSQLCKADAVIAETKKEKIFLEKYYQIKNVFAIPTGVAFDSLKENLPSFQSLTGIKSPYVLIVGRFDENKNQLNVIKAMRNSDITIVFIGGEISARKEYYNECRMLATPNMYFLGWINHNDEVLKSAYKDAKVLMCPSFNETFGLSIIEGGIFGANLIISKTLPILDWGLRDHATIINPHKLYDIRKAIESQISISRDISNPDKFFDKFAWESIVQQHLTIYQSVIKNRLAK